MDTTRPPYFVPILPTRVRRNYTGGLLLDELEGSACPADGNRPETWLASTTTATNPGMEDVPGEGLTRCRLGGGKETTLANVLASNPTHYLGARHAGALGAKPGFLAKLLDSAIRLHVQAHPTAAFARRHLGSPHGKLEVYHVLAVREGQEGYIRLGFQRPPSRAEWARIIATQDIAAMDACFDRIPVRPGETWLVPGGMPHAIGEGVLMVEVMEPTDLVVRCEFERGGIVVPEQARYMGRDLEFCLDIFDYEARSATQVRDLFLIAPERLAAGPGWEVERLIGAERTSCFEILRLRGRRTMPLPEDRRCGFLVQLAGASLLRAHGEELVVHRGETCLCAAAAQQAVLEPLGCECEALLCRPAPQP